MMSRAYEAYNWPPKALKRPLGCHRAPLASQRTSGHAKGWRGPSKRGCTPAKPRPANTAIVWEA